MPQFDYTHPLLRLGMIGTASPWTIDSYGNALLAQASSVTAGGVAVAGSYTVQIDGEEGSFSVSVTMAGGESTTVLIAALVAAFVADADLLNIVAATDADPTMNLAFLHAGKDYSITLPSNPGGVLSTALVQAAGGTAIPLGVGVVPGAADNEAQLPGGASTDADFLGIHVEATVDVKVNDGQAFGAIDEIEPGETLSIMRIGETVVATEDAVAFNGQVFMRIANPGPGQSLGGFRSDAAGGDAIALSGVRFRSSTTGAGLARVAVNRV